MIVIRPGGAGEAGAIARAHAQAHWETYAPIFGDAARRLDPAQAEADWRGALDRGEIVLVAADGARIVGVAHAHGDVLESLYLRASHRGQGLGRRLFAEVFDAFAARGVAAMRFGVLSTNAGAIAFYERCGALRTGSRFVRHPFGDHIDILYALHTRPKTTPHSG